VRSSIFLWLRLVVLEDKIERIKHLHKCGDSATEIKKELSVSRIWNPADYPCWLAFEAEKSIQIRQEQAEVAIHLLRNPSHVVQLNMGMGKTRK
jgi:hypothetical protein